MTEQEWLDILACTHAGLNSDSTSTYNSALRANEWILRQEWTE